MSDWEAMWAHYDDTTYRAALQHIRPDDVVLDIGAGDLRFARQVARRAKMVVAIERRADLLTGDIPPNLVVLCGDARCIPFPAGVTLGVLLMRHCCHFAEYARRLRAIGCTRLVTNARWGMAVELVSLMADRPFSDVAAGWYACRCGAVGFKECSTDLITFDLLAHTSDVTDCPACASGG
jgi:hypothetical protein